MVLESSLFVDANFLSILSKYSRIRYIMEVRRKESIFTKSCFQKRSRSINYGALEPERVLKIHQQIILECQILVT